jgi:acetyl esterase/lipase
MDTEVAAHAMFDQIMAQTLPAAEVVYDHASVGGVPGWWCHPTLSASDAVILYFHGGAYVMGSASAYRSFVGQVARSAAMSAFAVDYARAPERPSPAAMQDGLSAYRSLVDCGHERIVLAGDSAGGGLALALPLLASVCGRSGLPRPLRTVTFSPWTDLTLSGGSAALPAEASRTPCSRARRWTLRQCCNLATPNAVSRTCPPPRRSGGAAAGADPRRRG